MLHPGRYAHWTSAACPAASSQLMLACEPLCLAPLVWRVVAHVRGGAAHCVCLRRQHIPCMALAGPFASTSTATGIAGSMVGTRQCDLSPPRTPLSSSSGARAHHLSSTSACCGGCHGLAGSLCGKAQSHCGPACVYGIGARRGMLCVLGDAVAAALLTGPWSQLWVPFIVVGDLARRGMEGPAALPGFWQTARKSGGCHVCVG